MLKVHLKGQTRVKEALAFHEIEIEISSVGGATKEDRIIHHSKFSLAYFNMKEKSTPNFKLV